jgi:hypothetical protein
MVIHSRVLNASQLQLPRLKNQSGDSVKFDGLLFVPDFILSETALSGGSDSNVFFSKTDECELWHEYCSNDSLN